MPAVVQRVDCEALRWRSDRRSWCKSSGQSIRSGRNEFSCDSGLARTSTASSPAKPGIGGGCPPYTFARGRSLLCCVGGRVGGSADSLCNVGRKHVRCTTHARTENRNNRDSQCGQGPGLVVWAAYSALGLLLRELLREFPSDWISRSASCSCL